MCVVSFRNVSFKCFDFVYATIQKIYFSSDNILFENVFEIPNTFSIKTDNKWRYIGFNFFVDIWVITVTRGKNTINTELHPESFFYYDDLVFFRYANYKLRPISCTILS